MKEQIEQIVMSSNIKNLKDYKIHLDRKCSGKFGIFYKHFNTPMLSIPYMEGEYFHLSPDIFGIGMDEIILKYESDYIREQDQAMNFEEELKILEIPKKGIIVIKSDDICQEMIGAIRKGLKEKCDFEGAIFSIGIQDDIFLLTENVEIFKKLTNQIKSLEQKIDLLSTEQVKVD